MQNLELDYKKFLDRTTILYGESGAGKTTIIKDILNTLKPHIEQILVVNPIEGQNHAYEGIAPSVVIHEDLTPELLRSLWKRQLEHVEIYDRANDEKVIQSLFTKIPNTQQERQILDEMKRSFEAKKAEILRTEPEVAMANIKVQDMETDYKYLTSMTYKGVIEKNKELLQQMHLTEEEQFTLNNIRFNPRMVIILDDCTEKVAKLKNNEILQGIFFKGRHLKVTVIYASHMIKSISPELRRNAYVSIYMDRSIAQLFFKGESVGYKHDKELMAEVDAAIKAAFNHEHKYQKLVWIRAENRFYKYTAEIQKDFRFGSEYIWQFNEKARADRKNKNSNNSALLSGIFDAAGPLGR